MKRVLFGLSLGVATLLAGQLEVGLGGGRHAVSNSPIENYNFLNLRVSKDLKANNFARLEFERSEKVLKDSSHIARGLLNVGHYFPIEGTKLLPYAFIGGGYQIVSGSGYKDDKVADIGLGAKYPIVGNLNTFAELRGLRDFGNNDNHYGFLLGFLYNFGGDDEAVTEDTETPQPTATAVAVDSDNDGVVDTEDKCPNTLAGVKVDANGCPLDSDNDGVADSLDKCPNTPEGAVVDTNGCPLDSDHDGVYNGLDKCPNTPEGAVVDTNGCPLDSDHDGVYNGLDKCPNTPAGFEVDKNGCALTFNFEIKFDTDSAKIKPAYMAKIIRFANFLKQNPKYKAEIQGYTDNVGNAAYNQKLSERRAKAVYEALIKLGVSKSRLSYKGYGEANPVASNDTEEGRAKNRRVVAKLYY